MARTLSGAGVKKGDVVQNAYGYGLFTIEAEPMRQLAKHLAAVKVDLKAFTEKFYKEMCSGELAPVLRRTCRRVAGPAV